eukprot:TRINITY_DN553_c0_g1_i2.p1 TRINITY_DN553_c0_g1~~TRINITY_DN553_c0_g1_i2.p1  ORF type:complete len:266 (+),score=-10.88 TRINITY_DN553_c0_g1_i2:86-883(+)
MTSGIPCFSCLQIVHPWDLYALHYCVLKSDLSEYVLCNDCFLFSRLQRKAPMLRSLHLFLSRHCYLPVLTGCTFRSSKLLFETLNLSSMSTDRAVHCMRCLYQQWSMSGEGLFYYIWTERLAALEKLDLAVDFAACPGPRSTHHDPFAPLPLSEWQYLGNLRAPTSVAGQFLPVLEPFPALAFPSSGLGAFPGHSHFHLRARAQLGYLAFDLLREIHAENRNFDYMLRKVISTDSDWSIFNEIVLDLHVSILKGEMTNMCSVPCT